MAKSRVISVAKNEETRWQTESDMRTLVEARKIKADAKRMAAVKAMAKDMMLEYAEVTTETKE